MGFVSVLAFCHFCIIGSYCWTLIVLFIAGMIMQGLRNSWGPIHVGFCIRGASTAVLIVFA